MEKDIFMGKKIIVGITGSIAVYKLCSLVSTLVQRGAEVSVVMTEAGARFVGPITFQALTGNPVYQDFWEGETALDHILLTEEADLLLVAPATANTIAKMAHGIADNLLTAAVLAYEGPLLVAPAMNSKMYAHQSHQENLRHLERRGVLLLEPEVGHLACGVEGKGRLMEPHQILKELEYHLTESDLEGMSFLITAGGTREPLDPVRYLGNYSSGRMGYALAEAAALRGAEVLLVSGPSMLEVPPHVQLKQVERASEMHQLLLDKASEYQVIIKAAAVADFRPAQQSEDKIKKSGEDLRLKLLPNPDILAEVGSMKRKDQLLVGFALETRDLVAGAGKKLKSKNLDLVVANKASALASDRSKATLVTEAGAEQLPEMSKKLLAYRILDEILGMKEGRQE